MNLRFRLGVWLAALVCWATVSAPEPGRAAAADEDVAIIVNRANPVNAVSVADLRDMLLAERQHWPDGRRITLAVRQPGDPGREAMLRIVFKMTEESFTRHFLHAVFVGQAPSVPRTLMTANGMRRFVFNVPTAIGYVRLSELDESIKALRIDRLAAGQPGYQIKLKATTP